MVVTQIGFVAFVQESSKEEDSRKPSTFFRTNQSMNDTGVNDVFRDLSTNFKNFTE